jgi:hypothetical protein
MRFLSLLVLPQGGEVNRRCLNFSWRLGLVCNLRIRPPGPQKIAFLSGCWGSGKAGYCPQGREDDSGQTPLGMGLGSVLTAVSLGVLLWFQP